MIMHEWDIDRCRYVVYTWESGLLVYLCVCVRERERGRERQRERERGASVTQQPSLSIRPSLARSHATHASTRTFWHPHPAPAHLKARTISSWIPISLLRFVFSQYLTHTHTRARARTHTHRERERDKHNNNPISIVHLFFQTMHVWHEFKNTPSVPKY